MAPDEADRAQQDAEPYLAECVRNSRRPAGPRATGRCLWCDEIVGDNVRWCSPVCRDEWEAAAKRP